jgi:putative sigma-54 modulation protein
MKFVFTDKNARVSEAIKAHTEKKLGKFDRYFKHDSVVYVVFSAERGREIAEVTIHQGSMFYRAKGITQEMRASIDQASDILLRQIHKNKTRLEKRLKQGAFEQLPAEDLLMESEIDAEETYNIIRTKTFAIKPITPEEAILQMNMLGHQFFVFKDQTNSDSFAVVYQRNDGGYGLIEAE